MERASNILIIYKYNHAIRRNIEGQFSNDYYMHGNELDEVITNLQNFLEKPVNRIDQMKKGSKMNTYMIHQIRER